MRDLGLLCALFGYTEGVLACLRRSCNRAIARHDYRVNTAATICHLAGGWWNSCRLTVTGLIKLRGDVIGRHGHHGPGARRGTSLTQISWTTHLSVCQALRGRISLLLEQVGTRVLRLVLELSLDFFQIDFKIFLCCFEVLFFLLDIGFLTMNHLLEAAHRVKESLRQVN